MARTVLDASAAVHLVLNGPYAAQLVNRLEAATIVTTPDLFCSETANALWKYVRAGEIPLDLALTRLEQSLGLVDSLVPQRTLAAEALVAAARHQRSVYDMTYAVLARRSGSTVITMDRSFALALPAMEIESYCPLLESS